MTLKEWISLALVFAGAFAVTVILGWLGEVTSW